MKILDGLSTTAQGVKNDDGKGHSLLVGSLGSLAERTTDKIQSNGEWIFLALDVLGQCIC